MIVFIALATFVTTFLGGLFAIRFKDKLHLILGFSAGAMVGVAFFDLLPEALEIGGQFFESSTIFSVIAIGFVAYMILDRTVFMHCHEENHEHRGQFGAGSLSLHSFLDGIAIGFAFHVSSAVGIIVAVAVLAHNFSDGINTVSMILRHGGSKMQAVKWLTLDASAPVLGVISTFFFTIPESFIGLILALSAGFFLYIGASDLLPESHHNHPTHWTTCATVLGMAVIFFAVHLAGI
ncbi:MAG: ZIP family metal transporter [Patescibacteria group bacterium]